MKVHSVLAACRDFFAKPRTLFWALVLLAVIPTAAFHATVETFAAPASLGDEVARATACAMMFAAWFAAMGYMVPLAGIPGDPEEVARRWPTYFQVTYCFSQPVVSCRLGAPFSEMTAAQTARFLGETYAGFFRRLHRDISISGR